MPALKLATFASRRGVLARTVLLLCASAACSSSAHSPGAGSPEAGADGETEIDAGDAGPACAPASLGTWTPPPYHHGQPAQAAACTSALLHDFYASCLGPSASTSACDDNWGSGQDVPDIAHANCEQCLVTASSSPTWGPVVNYGPTVSINVSGCIELLDPSSETCAAAVQDADECEHQACDDACPALGEFDSCVTIADQGACASFAQASACQAAEVDGGRASVCAGATFEDLFFAVANVFCGGSD